MTQTSLRPGTRPAGESKWLDLPDGPVHYVDHGGPDGAPLAVLVHGLGGSHANWAALAPLLTHRLRVVAVDLAGFGLTTAGPRPASVSANADLLHRFVRQLSLDPVILVGNSMGGMISSLVAAEHPEAVRHLALVDPVLPLTAALPDHMLVATGLEGMLPLRVRMALARRRGPVPRNRQAMTMITLCCDDPEKVTDEVVDVHLALAARRGFVEETARDYKAAASSIVFTVARRRRYARLLHSIQTPVLLLHGTKDRLVPFRVARVAAAANPNWTFHPATGVGHVPMLEAPLWTSQRILEWIQPA
ncbi:alpha/beta fold hydrolase [Kineosporia succinea]|uniref:Pimeloyl-ACP methyl ester carboxylesterase n=1 Tax=Kineosporia succinea TaxID=84632 RepID=A0ABT9P2E4_9ACTN|nr:alpha/beta hydrolase [Kineosporia succinea]MDP9826849.1 pimeloyl-ACP methyl ester carboxylesterase [Kineosporia succinea]